MYFKHRLMTVLLSVALIITTFTGCEDKNNTDPNNNPMVAPIFSSVTYPTDAVKTLKEQKLSKSKFLRRAKNGNYEENTGYEGSGIVISPYFTAAISNTEIPVYGTLVYVGETGKGAIHSYSVIETAEKQFLFNIELEGKGFNPKKAVILPLSLGVTPNVKGKKISAEITSFGAYTFLLGENDQQHAYTLFVKEKVDEDAEINQYKELYGENSVKVYEPGVYYEDYLRIAQDNYTVYLKSGALLIANHNYSIMSEEDRASNIEEDSVFGNRHPFISADGVNNIRILGHGTIDLTQLDWHERNGIFFSSCSGITVEGITLVNSPEWSITEYCCNNVKIDGVTIFGYRTNSDGFAVCNSQNVTVTNCFARSGDDLFEVKTLGGDENAVSKNITFENCVGWNGKSRCYGITGEVKKPISDITFKNCAIIHRDAVWDNNRIGGLVVIVEEGGAPIKNVTFENIEIYNDNGRPVNVDIYNNELTDCVIENIVFKNISYSAKMQMQLKSALGAGNKIFAVFENINANGVFLSEKNISEHLILDEQCSYTIN